jgi:hypothetical protein
MPPLKPVINITHFFITVAVTPVAPNGTGTGEVAVDYVEVTVNYRQQ